MVYQKKIPLAASLSSRCISVSSMSKAYGLPGIRIGWLITRDSTLYLDLLAAKEQIFLCNSILDETVAMEFFKHKNEHWPEELHHDHSRSGEATAFDSGHFCDL